jgi:hypothetical protein
VSFRTPEDTELAATASQLLGDVSAVTAGAHVTLTANVAHGMLILGPDGSFRYRPDPGYVGPDGFRCALTLGGRSGVSVDVTLAVYHVDAPSPSPRDQFAIGSISNGGSGSPDVSFGSLGPLSFSFEWLIPSLVVSGPGLLVLLVIGAQLLAGAAWLPVVRRELGDFGLGSRRRARRHARP